MSYEDDLIQAAMDPSPSKFYQLRTGDDGPGIGDYILPRGRFHDADNERNAIRSAMLSRSLAEKQDPLSVGQFADITGKSPELAATANQYQTHSLTAPSQVPHYSMATQPNRGLGMGEEHPRFDPTELATLSPGMDDKTFGDFAGARDPGQPIHGPSQPDMLAPQVHPPMQRFQLPGNEGFGGQSLTPPSQAPLQEQRGPDMQYNERRINLDAPVNTAQRDVYKASIHKQSSPYSDYARGMGGANTLNAKAAQAFDYFKSLGQTDEQAHANAQGIASGAFGQRSLDDRRQAQTNQGQQNVEQRRNVQMAKEAMDQHRTRLIDAQAKLAEEKAKLTPQEYSIRKQSLDLAERKFQFGQDAFIMIDKAGVYNDETHKAVADHLAQSADLMGDTQASGFWRGIQQSMGVVERPQVQRGAHQQPTMPATMEQPPQAAQQLPIQDVDELRKATEQAMQNPGKFKGRKYKSNSGKEYTFNGKGFE